MANERFFEKIFASDPWGDIVADPGVVDEQNFFAAPHVFESLIAEKRPSTIVEIGTWKGHSANAMADICRQLKLDTRIVCIDTFLGSEEHWLHDELRDTLHIVNGRPTIYERFRGNVIARKNTDMIYPLPLHSNAAHVVMAIFGFTADLIYLDAGHEYEDVSSDIRKFWDFLTPGGTMFGDDYAHPPVAQAVRDFASAKGLRIMEDTGKWIYC